MWFAKNKIMGLGHAGLHKGRDSNHTKPLPGAPHSRHLSPRLVQLAKNLHRIFSPSSRPASQQHERFSPLTEFCIRGSTDSTVLLRRVMQLAFLGRPEATGMVAPGLAHSRISSLFWSWCMLALLRPYVFSPSFFYFSKCLFD